ncbi:hypothetical protein ACIGXM_22505 [Kitasatospora sp. NPDC052896]|uniref:DUF7933 domain-containing protein n=1 Tax=Kitasatospora sp. NPDC052896 TaxID=3364061 RepID=UPI0037CA06CC
MKLTHRPVRRRLACLTAIAAGAVVPMAAFAAPAQAQPLVPTLVVQKSHHPETFEQGRTGQYSITVTNLGPTATADAAVVVDTLPTGLTLDKALPKGCSAVSPTLVECDIAAGLAPGAPSAVTYTIPVVVDHDAPGEVVNTVQLIDGVTGALLDSTTDLTVIREHHHP